MSGVHEFARRRPAVFEMSLDSVEEWLTDRVWVVRLVDAGLNDGTPISTEQRFGPYLGKLYARVANDQRQRDHRTLVEQWQVAVQCPFEPAESDFIEVSHDAGPFERWRVSGSVNQRPAAWGEMPLWQAEVSRDSEF